MYIHLVRSAVKLFFQSAKGNLTAAVRRGRGWFIRADSIDNLSCGSLDVFEALAEELDIAAVQTDVILRCASRFEADCAANDKRDGFSLGLADALRRAAPTFVAMHHFVCGLVR